ncbi:hypothetical protein ACLB2K_014391 [Fragaria x ananassa]
MPANNIGFIVIYGLTFFFANFGPNSTTFVVPAEIFPARFRSTCHGISAAFGKAGAIIGAFGFLYASQNQDKAKADAGFPAGIGMKNSLLVLAVINAIGLFFTFLVPESKGKSLEEMSRENEEQEQVGDLEKPVAGSEADVPPFFILLSRRWRVSTPEDSSNDPDHFPSPASPFFSIFPARSPKFEVFCDLAGKLEKNGLTGEGKWSRRLLESSGVEARRHRRRRQTEENRGTSAL